MTSQDKAFSIFSICLFGGFFIFMISLIYSASKEKELCIKHLADNKYSIEKIQEVCR